MNKREQLHVAFIGAGGQAGRLYGSMDLAGFDVQSVGYASPSGRHANAVGRGERTLDWSNAYPGNDGYKELLSGVKTGKVQTPDVVVIAVPPYRTAEATNAVLEATPSSTAVFIEKPVALDPADARRIADRLEGSERVVAVGHQWVANPPMRLFREEVQSRVEKSEKMEIKGRWHGDSFYKAGPWWRRIDQSGGPLKEQGHPLHLIEHVLTDFKGGLIVSPEQPPQVYYGVPGELPEDVDRARVGELYVPTQIKAHLEFGDGTPVIIEASGIHTGPEMVDVVATFNHGRHNRTLVGFEKRRAYVQNGHASMELLTQYPTPAFVRQMDRFLQVVTGKEEKVFVGYNEAVQTLTTADTIMRQGVVQDKPIFGDATQQGVRAA